MSLANAGLGLAHGIAAALGIHAGVPHGLACAVLLPVAMRVNREVREADLAAIGEALCGRRFASASDGARAAEETVEDLCTTLGIPRRLRDLGVRHDQVPAIASSSRGSSMSGNPRQLSDGELVALLEGLL
jgi:alcohol dehydrogenase class IV